MNKKNKIIIFSLFILICISLSIIISISKDNKSVTNKSLSGLAVYVYDETTENYVTNDTIPTGSYALNETLSYCKGNGEIGEYDNSNGTISYTFTSSDQCYLYFSNIGSILNFTADGLTVTATIKMTNGINSFGLSTSDATAPSSWLTSDTNGTLSGTTYNLSYTASNAGTYYLWAKDTNGNTVVSSSSVTLSISYSGTVVIKPTMGSDTQYINVYDGQDATGTLLLSEEVANQEYSVTSSTGYIYIADTGTLISSTNVTQSSNSDHTGKIFTITANNFYIYHEAAFSGEKDPIIW